MADGALTASPPARLPAALRIAIVYVAARVLTTLFFLLAAELSGPGSRFGSDATIGSLSMGWDAQWYWLVAVDGYPADLPRDDSGAVAENGWAFMPLYPYLARALGLVLTYPVAAVLLSLVAGYLACLVLHRLLRERIGETAATWAVVLFATGPLAALFQMGYAESLFLLWLLLALRVLQQRRFGWLYLLIPLMGYTRPGVLAFSLLLALYGIVRWVRRRTDALPAREVVHIVALGLLAAVVGFSWQVIAGIVTAEPGAYLETELSWRRNWTGDPQTPFVPFDGFIQASALWFRLWGMPPWWGWLALTACVLVLAAVLLLAPQVRRLGMEIRLWSAAYLLYLLAVFFPQSSLFRLLLPLAPLYGALALPHSRAWRAAMLVLGIAGQWWWIYNMLALGNTYYQIP